MVCTELNTYLNHFRLGLSDPTGGAYSALQTLDWWGGVLLPLLKKLPLLKNLTPASAFGPRCLHPKTHQKIVFSYGLGYLPLGGPGNAVGLMCVCVRRITVERNDI